ncbi:hypothetical protein DFA_00210 [Cavenderia fasciculata]|uniref:UbiA prenyltransferase family protein n=1 Tax=Cavenderia fasciculata TaxID=261658 RepID=F4PXX2_CACFS|nr:uncharacterized protein DFA_00210 [Cavenderia fasciculata]EGG19632.1 hypothetical protein DFA_00210 [Cavenderia fasciculata]|eukprot:XP_004357926.1 hypothetical protein DFA_00210 [Cavenderia fasciculata]
MKQIINTFIKSSRYYTFIGMPPLMFMEWCIATSQNPSLQINDTSHHWSLIAGCILLNVLAHSMAYCFNSYVDFWTGVDDPKTSVDRTMFDIGMKNLLKIITFSTVSVILITVWLVQNSTGEFEWLKSQFIGYTALLIILAATYTHCKYVALGHINCAVYIFATSYFYYQLFTNNVPDRSFYIFSIVANLFFQVPIISNYHRDLVEDKRAGILTISILLGEVYSCYLLIALTFTYVLD